MTPRPIPIPSVSSTLVAIVVAAPLTLEALTPWNTSSARVAPIGSITIPSHFTTALIRRFGLTVRSSGAMTVGPVTTRIAPSRKATRQCRPTR